MEESTSHCLRTNLQYNDWHELESNLQSNGEDWLNTGQGQELVNLLSSLPETIRSKHPWFNYWLGRSLMQSDLHAARPYLVSSYVSFSNQDNLCGESKALSGVLDALWLEWDNCFALDPWLNKLAHLRTRLQAHGRDDLLPNLSRSAFAGLSIRRPNDPDLQFWENLCLQALSREAYSSNFLMRCLQLMIHYTWGTGNRGHSTLVLETLRTKFGKSPTDPVGSCIFYVVQAAHQHWFDVDIDSCSATLEQGLAVSKQYGLQHWEIPLLNCVLYKTCSVEHLDSVRNLLGLLGERIQVDPRPHDQAIHYHFRAYLAWMNNHHDEALDFAQQAYKIAMASGFAYSCVYYGVALAAIQADRGNLPAATKHLGHTLRLAITQKSDVMQFFTFTQGAAMAWKKNRLPVALGYLRRALHIGSRQRYFSIPWIKRKLLAQLLSFALDHSLQPDYVSELVSALKLEPPDPTPISWPYPIKIYTLGRFRILINNQTIAFSRKTQKKPLELLKALIALGGRDVRDEQLTETLWPDVEGDAAYDSLKTNVVRLRRLLSQKDAITLIDGKLSLDPKYCWVDTWAFERMLNQIENDIDQLQKAIVLYQGNFLKGEADICYSIAARERLRRKFLKAITNLCAHYEQQHQWQQAIDVYHKGLNVDDLAEVFYQGLMHCYFRTGQTAELEKVYQQCCLMLKTQLGVPPSAQTNDSYRKYAGLVPA